MRGSSNIPELKLSVLNKLVTKFKSPPNLMFSNMFPTVNAVSNKIKWESQKGSRGMTPFKAPGSPSPRTSPVGVAAHEAKAAFLGEKSFYDEEFLNNIRKEGTQSDYLQSQQRLARDLMQLTFRARRRKEWMISKMLTAGSFDYYEKDGIKLSVDYDIPSAQQVTLGANYKWGTGTQTDILGDIMSAKIAINDSCGSQVDFAICNSTVLKYMAKDASIQTFLTKSNFGNGDLFGANAEALIGVRPQVLASFLGISKFVVYDEKFVIKDYLTAALAAAGTTVYVSNAADFETGTATLTDVSAGTTESVTISAVDTQAGTITIGATTSAFKAGEDTIEQSIPYIPNTMFLMMASNVDGQGIADFQQAPYGLERHYGLQTDRWDNKDPDGVFVRVEDKGLPVLYQRDALYQLTVE